MFNIEVRRATEDDFGVITKEGKPLNFDTKEAAREWFNSNCKSVWIIAFQIVPAK